MDWLCSTAHLLVFCLLSSNFVIYGQAEQDDSESDDESESSTSSRSSSSSSSRSSSSSSRSDWSSKSPDDDYNTKKFRRSNAQVQDLQSQFETATLTTSDNAAAIPTFNTVKEVQNVTDKCVNCICEATGGCKRNQPLQVSLNSAKSDVGLDSACGPLSITRPYWEDAGSPKVPGRDSSTFYDCANDVGCATKTVKAYMARYPFDCNGDGVVNCSDYAAIHNRGPFACHNPLPASYEERFLKCWNGPSEEDTNKEESESWLSRLLRRKVTPLTTQSTSPPVSTTEITVDQPEKISEQMSTSNPADTRFDHTEVNIFTTSEPNRPTNYNENTTVTNEPVTSYNNERTTEELNHYTEPGTTYFPETITEENIQTTEQSTIFNLNSKNVTDEATTTTKGAETPTVYTDENYMDNSPTQTTFAQYQEETTQAETKTESEPEITTTFTERNTELLNENSTEYHMRSITDTTFTTDTYDTTEPKTNIESQFNSAVSTEKSPTQTGDYENLGFSTDTVHQVTDDITGGNELTARVQTENYTEINDETKYKTDVTQEAHESFTTEDPNKQEGNDRFYTYSNQNKKNTITTSEQSIPEKNLTSKRRKKDMKTPRKIIIPHQITDITDDCIHCICEAVSDCKVGACSNEQQQGPFRITEPYWKDAGEPQPSKHDGNSTFINCVNDPDCAERTVRAYMKKYKFDCNGDGVVNCTDYAAIHNNGPYACQEPLPNDYLNRFLRCAAEIHDVTESEYENFSEEPVTEKGILKNWFSNILDNFGS